VTVVRTFVALELSQPLKDGILALTRQMAKRGVTASWAKPGTMHLTLKFLGDVEEERIADVTRAVERAAAGVPPFAFETGGLGAFPTTRRPRVLWVGVDAVPELFAVAEALERELALLGFPRENERFRPHITLGRLRDPGGAQGLPELLAELTAPVVRVVVEDVLLMKSTLAAGGAIHERLAAVPLRAAGVTPVRKPEA
jgi:2'-5' RNA ligase